MRSDGMQNDDERTVLLNEEKEMTEKTVLLGSEEAYSSAETEENDREHTVVLGSGYADSQGDREETIFMGSGSVSLKKTSGPARRDYSPAEDRDWSAGTMDRCPNCMSELKAGAKFCPKCGFKIGTKPKEIYHLYPGMILAGRYMIGTVLGFGGFGVTYRAWDNKLNVMVAIKEFYPAGTVNRIPGEKQVILYTGKNRTEFMKGLERFLEEARNMAKFSNHPNIVNVFDYFEENGTAYIVMEFLNGISLREYMKQQGGRLRWDEAVLIVRSIIEALRNVHAAGILHRDISPDNIFMCVDGSVKLIDFGAARFSDGEEERTRSIQLKVGYAPPEQYRAKSRQGPYTDIYALGATMYRMVTGKVPEESLNRAVEDTLAAPRTLEPSIPEYLERAIMRAMALNPDFRFQNVNEFEDAILNKAQVLTIQETIRKRKRKRTIGIAAAAVILIGAAAAAGFIYNSKRSEALLAEAEISLWIPLRAGMEEADAQEIYETMISEFEKDYPQISFDISYMPEEEYQEQLGEAAEDGQLPTLFENSGAWEVSADSCEPLDGILERVNVEEYDYLDWYDTYFPEKDKMPLGFEAFVLYGNTTLADDESNFISSNDREAFLSGDSAAYVGPTSIYHQVQEALPGRYTVKALPDGEQEGEFTDLWSISKKASRAEKNAAERFLYYFLSERGQEILHVDNRGNLPLNKNQMKVYMEVNPEMDFLAQTEGDLTMVFLDDIEEEWDSLYQEICEDRESTAEYLNETN